MQQEDSLYVSRGVSMKIKIKHYWSDETFNVYGVRVFEDGNTCFLIYKDSEWVWINADLCIPDEGLKR